ncbi:TetR/AcrR family transcriptional regulator [Amylibacter sp. IMCC11727]|uniref:TetR/AcrR family transcriptional regulator n=1 Tax=Amylibacter sp. IMCC11727 TaxID=3039851 RepID=UPI00244E46FF|nr:TetR/AcrR family transcriptional regulator [Amylibacter sp. IMCC11727]WGI23158.1 TetR/AcrR family transcriptional regulator [Amylibacter sp. IMCC11727]
MAGIREQKRAALREKLLNSALTRIKAGGIASLRARDLATDAGCALGAIYNIFADLDELVFYAKAEVFRSMDAQLDEVMSGADALPPKDQMLKLSHAYHHFATKNHHTWTALFASDLADPDDIPDWYRAALRRLMGHISKPLAQLQPHLSETELSLRTRTIFSAIHGVILLSVQNRPSGVGETEVADAIEIVISAFSSV